MLGGRRNPLKLAHISSCAPPLRKPSRESGFVLGSEAEWLLRSFQVSKQPFPLVEDYIPLSHASSKASCRRLRRSSTDDNPGQSLLKIIVSDIWNRADPKGRLGVSEGIKRHETEKKACSRVVNLTRLRARRSPRKVLSSRQSNRAGVPFQCLKAAASMPLPRSKTAPLHR